jgi:hypothetical protein
MRSSWNCPFCGHNCRSLIEAHRDSKAMTDSAGLCGGCGEVLVVTSTVVRKPNDSEYLELGQQEEIKLARAAWQRLHDLQGKHDSTTIDHINRMVAQLPMHNPGDDVAAAMIRGSAITGAAMAVNEIKQRLEASRDYDDFFVSLLLLEQHLGRERDLMMNDNPTTTHTRSTR